MRHADSSPSIPPRFVAFARRYHPSTCGSLRRTPGATSTASGVVSRCPRPGGLSDGDDEASRVPGKPTRTHATRSDPGEVAASTASETRRDDLPSNARRRPSHSMHFGAQSRGLRAPCERFAPGVTPGPRITRFRLAADLGRMGVDTHRVSNKVSKITSRHLVPLDRAFPAHALAHMVQNPVEAAYARSDRSSVDGGSWTTGRLLERPRGGVQEGRRGAAMDFRSGWLAEIDRGRWCLCIMWAGVGTRPGRCGKRVGTWRDDAGRTARAFFHAAGRMHRPSGLRVAAGGRGPSGVVPDSSMTCF